MYCLNLLSRFVLITPDEVIRRMPTSSGTALDPKKVLHAIEIAEERFVRDALGYDFYEAIVSEKNKVVAAGNIQDLQQKMDAAFGVGIVVLEQGDVVNALEFLSDANKRLWNERLWKLTAEAVRMVAMPESYADFTNAGIMKNNPAVPIPEMRIAGNTSESVGLGEVKWLMDKWVHDRVNPMAESMKKFICKNAGDYPIYGGPPCEKCGADAVDSVSGKTGWLLDMYPDDDDMPVERNITIAAPPTPPAPAAKETYRLPFKSVPGSASYQNNDLKGAELISFSMEGSEIFIGDDPGEMQPLNDITGTITWNSPADAELRCVIIYKK